MLSRASGEKGLFDFSIASLMCMLQRRDAIIVGKIDVRAGLNQKLHDLLMALAAIAQDDRLEQSGPAEIVDMIDVDPGGDQPAHRFNMATLGRGDQRRTAIAIGAFQVGTMCKGHFEDFKMPPRP